MDERDKGKEVGAGGDVPVNAETLSRALGAKIKALNGRVEVTLPLMETLRDELVDAFEALADHGVAIDPLHACGIGRVTSAADSALMALEVVRDEIDSVNKLCESIVSGLGETQDVTN